MKLASAFPNKVNCSGIVCSLSCILRFKQIGIKTFRSKLRVTKAYQLFHPYCWQKLLFRYRFFFFPSESGHSLGILPNIVFKAAIMIYPRYCLSWVLFAILHLNPSYFQRYWEVATNPFLDLSCGV